MAEAIGNPDAIDTKKLHINLHGDNSPLINLEERRIMKVDKTAGVLNTLTSSLLHFKVLLSLHYDLCRRGFVLKEDPLCSVNLDARRGRRYLLKLDVYIKITCDRRNANFTLLR